MPAQYTIAIVDDDPVIRGIISLSLETDYQVQTYSSAEKALAAMEKTPPDLVLLDIVLPGMNGVEALGKLKRLYPNIPVIMITASEDVETVVSVMRKGAYDYAVKPLQIENLKVAIVNGLEALRLKREVQALQEEQLKEIIPFFVGASDAIQDVMGFIDQVARSPDTPVLILGETGTGKELVASAIHYRSPNFRGPFVTVNCAAIPQNLVESELFGYEEGAFTGALTTGKKGLIDQAAQGTLFLDEVGDLSLEAQAKLLRFIEAGEFYRVGGTTKVNVRTRVVSATNRNLENMIQEDNFRKDLYFRLGVVRVEVPSLNHRGEDILPLAERFFAQFKEKFSKNVAGLSPEATKALLSHNWVGNVRELKNLMERAVLICRGDLLTTEDLGIGGDDRKGGKADLLSSLPSLPPEGIDLSSLQKAIEKFYFQEALKMAKHNESQAARLLGMNHHTFRYRKKQL